MAAPMQHTHHREPEKVRSNMLPYLGVAVFVILAGLLGYAFFKITSLDNRLALLNQELASTTNALYGETGALSKNLTDLSSTTQDISQTLSTTKQDVANVNNNVSAVQDQVGGVEKTVGSLQKLVTIDPELLKKYSKVYFLNENYAPAHLSIIPQDLVYSNTRQESFLQEALPFLQNMMAAAKADGHTMFIDSAYRSFAKQQTLKSQYKMTFGAGTASSFSADQGYSEHQLGTAIDIILSGSGGDLTKAFDGTPAFTWLSANAYKYGFELSYPKGNGYYVYEPWHWRFVGVKLATYLHDNNKRFYDLDQRDIDTFLASLFDS